MAGNKVLSTVSLAIAADTAKYETNLAKAKQQTVKEITAMGSSMAGLKQTAVKEFGAAAKATEQLADKSKSTAKALKEQAAAAKANLKEVAQAHKEAAKEAAEEAKAVKKAAADERKAIKEVIEELKHRTEAESKAAADSKRYAEQMAKAFKGSSDQVTASTKTLGTSLGGLKAGFAGLAAGVAAAFTVSSAKRLLETASSYNTLNQRVKTATKETGDYAVVQERLYKIAIKNGAQMSDTVSVYQGLARSAKELGASSKDVLALTDTVQKLGVIGGSSATAMSAGLLQFSQAMAGGVVHAEEWNSIVENMPEVAHRIAQGMGMTDGAIRAAMLSGNLLSKDVFAALLKQSGQVSKDFSAIPRSMQQAYAGLETATGKALSKIDSITGATKLAVSAIDGMTSAFERLAKEAGKTFEINGKKTDMGHAISAGVKGAGRNIRDAIGNAGDLFNTFNPFTTEDKRPTLGEVEMNRIKRELNKQELISNELTLPGEDKAVPGPKVSGGPAKTDKKHAKDVQKADDLIASMKAQNAELEAKLRHDDEAITKEKALLKLSKDRTLTDAERNKYAKEINVLAARHAELIRAETIQKEQEKLKEILAGHKEKIELLKNELSDQTEGNALLEANKQIQNAVKVGKVETLAAQKEILAAAKEEAILRDAVKLKSIEESYRQQLESTKAKNDKAKELLPILEAEKKIRDAITAGMGENLDKQQKIRDLAKQIADEQLSKSFEDEQAKLDKIGESMADENEKLKLKLKGQENLAKYLDGERDVRKQIAEYAKEEAEHIKAIQDSQLSEPDKADRIKKVQDGYSKLTGSANSKIDDIRQQANENTRLNQALSDQEQILQNIKDSTGSYKSKLADLDAQYLKGNITQKQWQKTAEELWKSQTKSAHTVGDAIKQMGQSMTTAIMNGTKLTDVFKNMGKSLAALAAQKFVFEPIANAIDNWSSKLFGTGKYTAKPTMPGAGGSLASGSQTGSMLGNALGGPVGGGNLSQSSAAQQALDIAQMMGLPKFADGGYFGGGPMLVGEKGPEIVWPQSGGWVQNNQSVMSMFGGYGAMSGNGGFSQGSGGRYGGALSDIGGWQQQLQSGYNSSNQQLGYFERQELSQKIAEKYRATMDWNWGDQRALAQVADDMAREEARRWLQNPTTYNGVVNTNELQRMTLRATYGTGAVQGVIDGGRAGWGAGDQMLKNLQKAQGMGVGVGQQLLDKAGFDAQNWKNSSETFNPTGPMDPYNWIGRGSYHSMGVGAGEGNTNYGAVYGGDFWDPRTGANGSERMDAMGGKDFMWDKFHNFQRNGYEGVTDMWARSHTKEYQSGRDFIGDPTYGPRQFPGFAGTTSDRIKANKGLVDYYGDQDSRNWRPGRERAMVDQPLLGKYTLAGGIAVPQYGNYGRIPESGYEKYLSDGYVPENSGDFTKKALNGLRGRTGNETNEGVSQDWQRKAEGQMTPAERRLAAEDEDWMRRNGGTMDLGYSKKYQENNFVRKGGDNFKANQKAFENDRLANDGTIKPLIPFGDNVMKALYAGVNFGGLNRIVSPAFDVPSGGAVGAPGRLSTSNDVFDNYGSSYGGAARMTDAQRLNSPYRNFADGFDNGYFGARTGADIGATAPKGGWQIRAYQQGGKQIRAYAKGGDIAGGQLALVGEKGPELIVPKSDGRVIPNDQLMTRRGNEAPVITLVNNTGVRMSEPEFIQHEDGSIGLYLNAMAANAAKNGAVARGVQQAGGRVVR